MKKPIIGVLGSLNKEVMPSYEVLTRICCSIDYFQAIEKAGGIPIMLPITDKENIESQISLCDGFVFPGGMDINPLIYEEEPHPKLGINSLELDKYQYEFIKRVIFHTKKSFFAICRGYQMLNIVLGGNLYQDISEIEKEDGKIINQHIQLGHSSQGSHSIIVEKGNPLYDLVGEKYTVNSYHHQSIKKLGKDLKIIAKSKDNVIEAIEYIDDKRSFAIGVQWHPEHMAHQDDKAVTLFKKLIEAAKQEGEKK